MYLTDRSQRYYIIDIAYIKNKTTSVCTPLAQTTVQSNGALVKAHTNPIPLTYAL